MLHVFSSVGSVSANCPVWQMVAANVLQSFDEAGLDNTDQVAAVGKRFVLIIVITIVIIICLSCANWNSVKDQYLQFSMAERPNWKLQSSPKCFLNIRFTTKWNVSTKSGCCLFTRMSDNALHRKLFSIFLKYHWQQVGCLPLCPQIAFYHNAVGFFIPEISALWRNFSWFLFFWLFIAKFA